MPGKSLPDCVILVDAENVSPSALPSLLRWLHPRFNVSKAIGFADFDQPALSGAQAALQQLGITTHHVPSHQSSRSYRKNLVDSTLMVETLMIHAHDPHKVGTYVLVSGDVHFEPMVRALRADGKRVIVAASQYSYSYSLRRAASQFFALQPHRHGSPALSLRSGGAATAGRPQ
jgi:hypothetical protein